MLWAMAIFGTLLPVPKTLPGSGPIAAVVAVRAERLVAALTRAMTTGERIRSVDRGLHRALLLGNEPVADREGALLIEAQLLGGGRGQDVGHGVLLLGGLALRALAQMPQDILGGRTGAAHLAHMVQLLGDDLLVVINEIGAFPYLHEDAAEQHVQPQ